MSVLALYSVIALVFVAGLLFAAGHERGRDSAPIGDAATFAVLGGLVWPVVVVGAAQLLSVVALAYLLRNSGFPAYPTSTATIR